MSTSTHFTFNCVGTHLPEGAAALLEVGCGSGQLAAELAADGLELLALDSDPSCVAQANELGVDTRLARWQVTIGGSFDAILFTRSLHHIAPLEEAIAQAIRSLRPGGKIIVE